MPKGAPSSARQRAKCSDAALAEARKAIYMQGQDIEWGIPVLYMRSPNGQLFDVEPAADIKVAPRPKPDFSPPPQKSDSGGINISVKGDVSGQFAVGNKITQISKPDDSED